MLKYGIAGLLAFLSIILDLLPIVPHGAQVSGDSCLELLQKVDL